MAQPNPSSASSPDKYAQLREAMEIHIEENLYDENKLQPLEDYVNKQVAGEALYDFDSNAYLMKMYSLYPSKAKRDIVVKLLLKALMNLPESDFTSLIYMIPITMQSKVVDQAPKQASATSSSSASASTSATGGSSAKEIEVILNLGQYLEDCEFELFWKEYGAHGKLFGKFKNFEFEIRRYICQMVQAVYQTISLSFLSELLQLDNDKDLKSFIQKVDLAWTVNADGNEVTIPKTDENSNEVQRATQFISTDSMNQILATFSF